MPYCRISPKNNFRASLYNAVLSRFCWEIFAFAPLLGCGYFLFSDETSSSSKPFCRNVSMSSFQQTCYMCCTITFFLTTHFMSAVHPFSLEKALRVRLPTLLYVITHLLLEKIKSVLPQGCCRTSPFFRRNLLFQAPLQRPFNLAADAFFLRLNRGVD